MEVVFVHLICLFFLTISEWHDQIKQTEFVEFSKFENYPRATTYPSATKLSTTKSNLKKNFAKLRISHVIPRVSLFSCLQILRVQISMK